MRIQTLNEIADVIYDYLPTPQFEVGRDVADPQALLVRSADVHSFALDGSLQAIARAGAGYNNIPVDRCTEAGIVVFNTPGANANAVKELVISAMVLSCRHVPEAIEWTRTLKGRGDEVPKLVEKGKKQFVGPEIKGKTLGVIGLGAIGAMVANDAHALGMEVLGYDPYISVRDAWRLSRAVRRAATLEELLAQSDFVSIHVPLMKETRGYLGAEAFAKAKPGLRLMNFSRNELVDNQALIQALEQGRVAGYVTDFPSEDLLDVKGVICIPHLGSSTPESEENCAAMAARQLNDFLLHGNIVNSVNFPACELPRGSDFRLAITHKNVPSMVGQITSLIAAQGINISHMINKSRGAIAYTLVDLDNAPSQGLMDSLIAIAEVIRVTSLG